MQKIIPYAHQLISEIVQANDTVIDATCGNGHDTLFLAGLTTRGNVYSFDIQSAAIQITQNKLKQLEAHHVTLIHDSHAELSQYINQKVKAAIFNLGYLPSGDKSIVTEAQSTLKALESLGPILEVGGRIVIVIYHGHPGGITEKNALIDYVSRLDQQYYQVLQYQFINQRNAPPFIIAIEKIKHKMEV